MANAEPARKETRKQQAIELRLAGLSTSQIAQTMGLKGSGSMSRWLKGVPPPDWTRRPTAKDEAREQAIALRRQGMSYRAIESRVGVSRGTLSLWLRDVELSVEQSAALDPTVPAVIGKRAQSNRATWARRRAAVRARARQQVDALSATELFVAGVVAYWAEGSKNKPWRNGEQVAFINSDPDMICLFLRWLDLVGIDRSRLVFRVSIHESADSAAAVAFWASVVGVPPGSFRKTTLKHSRPVTIRRNVNDDYHGCCIVRVYRSAELNLRIAGWFEGLTSGARNHT